MPWNMKSVKSYLLPLTPNRKFSNLIDKIALRNDLDSAHIPF